MAAELRTLSESTLEAVILGGDLSKLSPKQRVEYVVNLCNRVGLDPATQPFQLMTFQGKMVAYAGRGCAAQLNQIHGLSHQITGTERVDDLYIVYDRCTGKGGRSTDEMGAVSISGKKGDDLANALMKGRTKAMRRATLTHVGLGVLDETEVESLQHQGAVIGTIDDPPAVVPQVEWTDEERSAAAGMVADLAEALLEAGMPHEKMQEVIGAPSSKIGDPELSLNTWMNRILTLRERQLKKLEVA